MMAENQYGSRAKTARPSFAFKSKASARNFTKVMLNEKGPRKTGSSEGPPITSEPVRRIGLGPPFGRDPDGDYTD